MSDPDAPDWGIPAEPVDPGALMMATPALLELARKVRGPAWADRLSTALEAARVAGWDWGRRGKYAATLIFEPSGEPRFLSDAALPAVKPAEVPPAPQDAASRGADLARRLMAERAAERRAADGADDGGDTSWLSAS